MTLPIKGKFVSDRGIANIFLRPDDKMCSYGAWHYLLSQAAFKDHQTNYKGHIITIKRGDFPTTYRKLAEIFNWSVGRVRRFIKNAEVAGHVITSVDTGFLIITLCDYNKIQSFNVKADTLTSTEANTVVDSQVNTTAGTNITNIINKTNETGGSSAPRADTHAPLPHWHNLVKKDLGDGVYKSWIQSLFYENGYIFCPNQFHMQRVVENYKDQVTKALCQAGLGFEGFKVNPKCGVQESA
tara:strand:+ start:176 stop:898 length:723 start_codon:yes stop_codon:yes gene_type:complete